MINEKIIIAALLLIIFLWFCVRELKIRNCLNKYWNRSYFRSAKKWKSAFQKASKGEIRIFLEALIDGFAFNSSKRLNFQPNDKIIDIYLSIYGGKTPFCDSLELETFYSIIEETYLIDIENIWHEEMTLYQRIRIGCERAAIHNLNRG